MTLVVPVIHVFDSAQKAAEGVARRFIEIGLQRVVSGDPFRVVLAGGVTPRRTYETLASPLHLDGFPWQQVQWFFGDERAVPHYHPESNYQMARKAFLDHLPIEPSNVFPIAGDGDAAESARAYEAKLRQVFPGQGWPHFDLVMLGMGEDGQTASLFPGTSELEEQRAWVVATQVPELHTWRITLTAPAINHARHILFHVTGSAKAARLRDVLAGERLPGMWSSQRIQPVLGTIEWYLDRAAAASL